VPSVPPGWERTLHNIAKKKEHPTILLIINAILSEPTMYVNQNDLMDLFRHYSALDISELGPKP